MITLYRPMEIIVLSEIIPIRIPDPSYARRPSPPLNRGRDWPDEFTTFDNAPT
jgi:hypothetical protein